MLRGIFSGELSISFIWGTIISTNCPSDTEASKWVATDPSTRTTPCSISLRSRDLDRLAETGASRERALSRRPGGFAVTKKDIIEEDKIVPQKEILVAPTIKFLKLLVTVLAGVMIIGFVIIVSLFILNFRTSAIPMPAKIELPSSVSPVAYTQTKNWYAIITDQDEILIYDKAGNQIQKIKVDFVSP